MPFLYLSRTSNIEFDAYLQVTHFQFSPSIQHVQLSSCFEYIGILTGTHIDRLRGNRVLTAFEFYFYSRVHTHNIQFLSLSRSQREG